MPKAGPIGLIATILMVMSGGRWLGDCGRVSGKSTPPNLYRGFRLPAQIINQAVWLYPCFSLSLREAELILAAQGGVVSYETSREWSLRFGR